MKQIMAEIRVQYKTKYFLLQGLLLLLSTAGVLALKFTGDFLMFALTTPLFLCSFFYLALAMPKSVVFQSGKVFVRRHFLKSFTIEAGQVLSFGSDIIKSSGGSIRLTSIRDPQIILEHFISLLEIENKEELLGIVSRGEPFIVYFREAEFKKTQKELSILFWFGAAAVGMSAFVLVWNLFTDDFPAISLIFLIIFIIVYLVSGKFEQAEITLKNKVFNKALLPVSLSAAVALSFLLYRLLIFFGIDLIKKTL